MNIFEKGGPVMFLLAGLSVYVLAVILFKAYQFILARITDEKFVEPVMDDIQNQRFEKAMNTLAITPGSVALVMRTALECLLNRTLVQETRQAEIQRVGNAEVRYLETHLRGLDLVANVGPLLGLLGTVIGMVDAFSKLQEQGSRIDPSQLAGGIWEALLTTAGGLIIAIPALAAYNILDGIIERVRTRMRDVSVRILALDDTLAKLEKEENARREAEARLRAETERRTEDRKRIKEIEMEKEKLQGEKERLRQESENKRYSPEKPGTLKLLNPKY